MSFLRRIVTFATAPSASAAVARRPFAGGAQTLGQFVRPRRHARPTDLPAPHAGFAPVADQELNNGVWPEAGADSALGENSVPGVNPAEAGHRKVDLRQPVSDPWEVAGDSEPRGVPSKHRSQRKLEVSRLSGERIQSGKSVESAQRPVFDTSAKVVSEWTKVHTNPPSHRPAKPSPAPAAVPAPSTSIQAAAPDVSSPDSSPVPRQASSDAAFPGTNEPDSQAEAVLPGGLADRARGTAEMSRTVKDIHGAVSPYTSTPSPPTMHSNAADTGPIANDTVPASSSEIVPEVGSLDAGGRGSPERLSRPVTSVAHAYSVHAPGSVEFASSSKESQAHTEPRHDAPAPAVHIGTVEIFIEAATAPRTVSPPASREGDFASRHYLRGL